MRTYFWLLSFIFIACKPVYIPNGRNSPLFTGGGEVQVSAALSTGDFGSGSHTAFGQKRTFDVDFQSAVSLTPHLAIMGNYAYSNRMYAFQHHWLGEGGLGYYSNRQRTCFEIFSGFGRGYGTTAYKDKYSQGRGDTSYGRFFIQPAFGWNKKLNHISLVSRFSVARFSRYGEEGKPLAVFFFEPGLLGKVNMLDDYLFLQWQVGCSIDGSKNYPGNYLDDIPISINVGLGVRVGHDRK